MFDKVFASFFSFDTYCDLWRKKRMLIDTLEIQMTRISRQLENYKLRLKFQVPTTLGELPKLT